MYMNVQAHVDLTIQTIGCHLQQILAPKRKSVSKQAQVVASNNSSLLPAIAGYYILNLGLLALLGLLAFL